jgi:hypothetical protein
MATRKRLDVVSCLKESYPKSIEKSMIDRRDETMKMSSLEPLTNKELL